MSLINFETAIANFLTLGQRPQAAEPLTGEQVLNELTAWYRDCRIESAAIDDDADMLLLQWGATRQLIVAEPMDLRKRSDDDPVFAAQEVRYLHFTRQVFAADADVDEEVEWGEEDEDGEVEFDDTAVQMHITLGFQP